MNRQQRIKFLVLLMYGLSFFIIVSAVVGCDLDAMLPHHIDHIQPDGTIYHNVRDNNWKSREQCEYMRDNVTRDVTRCHLT